MSASNFSKKIDMWKIKLTYVLLIIGIDSLWISNYEEAMSVLNTKTVPLNLVFRRGLMHSLTRTGASVAKESMVRTYFILCHRTES